MHHIPTDAEVLDEETTTPATTTPPRRTLLWQVYAAILADPGRQEAAAETAEDGE